MCQWDQWAGVTQVLFFQTKRMLTIEDMSYLLIYTHIHLYCIMIYMSVVTVWVYIRRWCEIFFRILSFIFRKIEQQCIPSHLCQRNFNTLRLRQDGRLFPDDTFKLIFLNENVRISIKISLKFLPKGPINNNPSLVQIMAWRRSGDKPLSEPRMESLLTHICVTRPQWVKWIMPNYDCWWFGTITVTAPECHGILNHWWLVDPLSKALWCG